MLVSMIAFRNLYRTLVKNMGGSLISVWREAAVWLIKLHSVKEVRLQKLADL